VFAEHVPEWVGEGLNMLVEQRLVTRASFSAAPGSAGAAAAEADVIAGVSIRRLYTRGVATDLEAVVALEVRYTRDGRAMQRDYRASAQKLNWFAAESEVQEVLNRALEDVVQQMAGDLGAVCAGKARTQHAR
jgi:ribonuclease PH